VIKEEAPRRSQRLSKQQNSASSASVSLLSVSAPNPTSRTASKEDILELDSFERDVVKDVRYVVDYSRALYDHFLLTEPKYLPSSIYMKDQTDITARMRAILIDWLVEVHLKFKMQAQTLHICVNVLDRFLERRVVKRDELQLIGCTALWCASKIEEIYSPEVQDFVHISDRAFKRKDILDMEGDLLNALDFKLTFPTPHIFLTRFLRVAGSDKKQRQFAAYCVERTLQEYSFLEYKPSMVAAAGVFLSMEVTEGQAEWSSILEHHSSYSEHDLANCVREMRNLVAEAENRSLLAVRKKYLSEDQGAVAKIVVQRSVA
jgi:cyclin B